MPQHHVIIGGGPAATNCLETIREFDQGASRITLICDEPAHSRMALPYWLAGKIQREQTHTADAASLQRLQVDARIGLRVTKVDPAAKTLALSDGSSLAFDDLLIATGSSPVSPPIPGANLPGVQPLWSLAHTEQVLKSVEKIAKPRVVLVGAGFIGFIVLNAMFKRGWQLSVVEREPQVLPRMLDAGSAKITESWLHAQKVGVHTGTTVTEIKADGAAKLVKLSNGTQLPADVVILATGIKPNLDLIASSGIQTDAGILVNDRLQTNFPFIYAAGDIAQGPALFADQPEIHAIQTTAVDHGRVAGANMAGQDVHYPGSLLMNVVDVCGLQSASFGRWNDTAGDAMTITNEKGNVYRKLLWRGDQLVGAIFLGQSNDMGMLTDVGMVKGLLQTQTHLGPWKEFLAENPFDIRRPYIATGVAQKLVGTTLLGRPTRARQFHFGGAKSTTPTSAHHELLVSTKK